MPAELPFNEIEALAMSRPVRFNRETADESTPNTDNPIVIPSLGGVLIVAKPLFEMRVESISFINKHLPPEERHPAGEINAKVTIQGRPVSRPVYVLNQECERVYVTHSDSQGRYRAIGLHSDQRYVVVALDKPGREYNAAISDYVKPE
ncbi:MAG: hypothetical protein WBH20_03280 [Oceanisphaera sp.]|uniref:hypothetical protein n=1 Tax=Oceanisphaera sp. TaxID=1929979 RepID=UPI003C77DEF5